MAGDQGADRPLEIGASSKQPLVQGSKPLVSNLLFSSLYQLFYGIEQAYKQSIVIVGLAKLPAPCISNRKPALVSNRAQAKVLQSNPTSNQTPLTPHLCFPIRSRCRLALYQQGSTGTRAFTRQTSFIAASALGIVSQRCCQLATGQDLDIKQQNNLLNQLLPEDMELLVLLQPFHLALHLEHLDG